MSSGEVNRAEWAKLVDELLDEIPKRNKAELARRIGYRERTIDRWLKREVNVAESSVRQVAERTGRNPMEVLIRVGFYRREELPQPEIPPEDVWIIDVIQGSTRLDERKKAALTAMVLEQERADREERRRRLEAQIEVMAGPPRDGDARR